MAKNIEIKARQTDAQQFEKAGELADQPLSVFDQMDVFFGTRFGMLKLRIQTDTKAHLIAYQRETCDGPKLSSYEIAEVEDAETMERVLRQSLGCTGRVEKTRRLWIIGQTRIHFDEVKGLGNFIELEVVLDERQSQEDGHTIARQMMRQLDIKELDLISESYVDLIRQMNTNP